MSLVRLIFIIILFYLIYLVLKGWAPRKRPPLGRRDFPPDAGRNEELIQDPECGVFFPKSEGVAHLVNGRVLYFHSQECRDKYLRARASHKGGYK